MSSGCDKLSAMRLSFSYNDLESAYFFLFYNNKPSRHKHNQSNQPYTIKCFMCVLSSTNQISASTNKSGIT